jgi:hypothetical protein
MKSSMALWIAECTCRRSGFKNPFSTKQSISVSPCRGQRPHHVEKDRIGTWEISRGVHHADFGRGRYSVARTHGRVPRFVVRWHRSRGPFTEGKNITGRPALMLLRFVEHSKLPVAGKI